MDNMHSQNQETEVAETAKKKKKQALIENLEKERMFLNNQIEIQAKKSVSVTRRYANPNKEQNRELRKLMTNEINSKRSLLIAKVAEMPITEEML